MVRSQGFRQDPCEKAHVCSTELQRGRSKPRAQIIRRLTLESGRWDGARTAVGENAGASRAARFALTCPARVSLPSWVVRVARLLPCWLSAPQTCVLRQSWAKGSPVLSYPKRSHSITSATSDSPVYPHSSLNACVCSVVSDSLQSHGQQPARLLGPYDFPGKNTGLGHRFPIQGM